MHFVVPYIASVIVCGAPSFSNGMIVEPFCSTTVGSEMFTSVSQGFYQKEGEHCCVGKMGDGSLTLRVYAQV